MNHVKELRTARGLSQAKLAADLHVHQTAVSQWETGRCDPDMETAIRLADYFSISLDCLMGRTPAAQMDEIYMNLARSAQDRKLRLSREDVDFLLDFAERLKQREDKR